VRPAICRPAGASALQPRGSGSGMAVDPSAAAPPSGRGGSREPNEPQYAYEEKEKGNGPPGMRAALPTGLKPRDKRGPIRAREPRMPPPKHRPRVYRGHNGKIQNSGRRPISSTGGGRPRGLKSTRALRRCTGGRKGGGAFVVSGRRCCGGRGWRGQRPRRHCGLRRAADPKCSSTDRAQGGTAVIRAGRGQAAACYCSGSAAAARAAGSRPQVRQAGRRAPCPDR